MKQILLKSIGLALLITNVGITGYSRKAGSRSGVEQEVTRADVREDGQRMATLDGDWTVVASDWDDPKDKDRGKGLKCVVKGDAVIIKAPGEDKPIGGLIIKLDGAKKPKTINAWSDESSFGKSVKETVKEPPVLGIYELEGDTLKVCWVRLENRSRPTKFPAKRGSGDTVIVLKRDKKTQ